MVEAAPIGHGPGYGFGPPTFGRIDAIFRASREEYVRRLNRFLGHTADLARISTESDGEGVPCWDNQFFFGLDAVALYGTLVESSPRRYLEVGSGYSTLFARQAIADHDLPTRITSIDPQPRTSVDLACDEIIRGPVQDVPLETFTDLQAGDVLFIDSSHVAGLGSDVSFLFLEVIPSLQPGVLVHVHDIFLPWDYRPDWADRGYSEQYLVGVQLLAPRPPFEVLFPAFYVHLDPALSSVLQPLWSELGLTDYYQDPLGLPRYASAGHSLWLVTAGA